MPEPVIRFGETMRLHAELRDARFQGVNLRNAQFRASDLRGAEFKECDLSYIDLLSCNLTGMRIDGILVTDLLEAFQTRAVPTE